MNISSMTGFARLKKNRFLLRKPMSAGYGRYAALTVVFWMSKSNFRQFLSICSNNLKTEAASCFSRGNVTATLMMENNDSDVQVRINEKLLEDLMMQLNAVSERISGKKESAAPADLLNVRGVVECRDNTLGEEAQKQLDKALVESFGEVCAALKGRPGRRGPKR